MGKVKTLLSKIKFFYQHHEYLRVFSIIWLIAFACFAPYCIINGLALPINGDYSLQQLHFYVEGRNAFWTLIKTGEFKMWSYNGFLGYNYFASNTFYYVTSPFSLPIYLLPSILVPQGIFIMMTIKIATGGLFMYILFKKFYRTSTTTAYIGAIAYGLCGWGFFYLWFNHFHDVLAVLPLTLLGVEYCIQKRKGWLLTVALFCCGLVNYYFLFTFVFSTLAYALFRYFQCFKNNKGFNLSIIIKGFIYSALGIGICAFILLPAAKVVLTMSRATGSNTQELLEFFFVNPQKIDGSYVLGDFKSLSEFFSGANIKAMIKFFFVFDSEKVRSFILPIAELVYPETGCTENIIIRSSYFDNFYSSLWISMPLLILIWPSLFRAFKSKKPSHIVASILLLVSPFIPGLYILFSGFSNIMYGRWLIVIVIFMLAAVIPIIDHLDEIPSIHYDYSFLIIITLQIIVIAVGASIDKLNFEWYSILGTLGVIIYTCVAYYIFKTKFTSKDVYVFNRSFSISKVLLAFVVLDILVVSNISINVQGVQNYWKMYGGQDKLNEQRELVNDLQKEDPSFYRIFDSMADRNENNLALTLNYKGLGSFHSINNANLNTFIQDWTRASYSNGNWSMSYDEKLYDLDTFLNVKYYLLDKDDVNIPLGFSKYKESKNFIIYKNDYFVELGFAFDTLMDIKDFRTSEYFMKASALTKYAIVNSNDVSELQSLLNDDVVFETEYTSSFSRIYQKGDLYFKAREEKNYSSISSISKIKSLLPENREEGQLFGPWEANNMPNGDTIRLELKKNSPLCSDASINNAYHLIVKLCYGPNVNIRLYHDNELISQDSFGINNYDHSSDHKYARGFYITKSVTAVELEILNDTTVSLLNKYGFTFFAEPFSDYQNRMQNLAINSIENIKHTNNTLDFTTNYADKKFVVLSVPYDEGWKLTVNGSEEKIYVSDSGFIGFIANEGVQSYHLQYTTPNLLSGIKISAVSVIIFLGLSSASIIITKKKKKEDKPLE